MIELAELERVLSLIPWWISTIKTHNAVDFYDINKVAEGLALKLLNEIYDYNLENLNHLQRNYPGIDLGDRGNKIGFQITSRTDSRKIQKDLKTFTNGPNRTFTNGIRFLILSLEKKPKPNKEKCQTLVPTFAPEKHILTAGDLTKEIRQLYNLNREKFYRIKEILEIEIAGKAKKKEDLRLLHSKLFEGSKRYHEALTGPNGRFKHLNISDVILPHPKNEWINQQALLDGEDQKPRNILEALPKPWNKECPHCVILGEGGMGKTVSIIRLWKEFLEKRNERTPVPIFIALNEFNRISDASKRENFIVSMIRKNYGDETVSNESLRELVKTPLQPGDDSPPSLILLLDGFNEITIDERELLLEIRHLLEQSRGVQIVITSRYDMRGNFNWNNFNLLKLLELEDRQVDLYLKEKGEYRPPYDSGGVEVRLRKLLNNPMMLTLYASTCEVQKNHLEDKNCDFKKQVETPGELLWNFLEAQVARLPERIGDEQGKQCFYKFLLRFLLPSIGFEMEKSGRFELSSVFQDCPVFLNYS